MQLQNESERLGLLRHLAVLARPAHWTSCQAGDGRKLLVSAIEIHHRSPLARGGEGRTIRQVGEGRTDRNWVEHPWLGGRIALLRSCTYARKERLIEGADVHNDRGRNCHTGCHLWLVVALHAKDVVTAAAAAVGVLFSNLLVTAAAVGDLFVVTSLIASGSGWCFGI